MSGARRLWAPGVLWLATVLGLPTGAVAGVVYQGSWDPQYGADFPGMSWRAAATLVIPTGCVNAIGDFTGTLDLAALRQISSCSSDIEGFGGVRLSNVRMGLYPSVSPTAPSTDLYSGADYVVPYDFESNTDPNDGNCSGACLLYLVYDNGSVVGLQTSLSADLGLESSENGGYDSDIVSNCTFPTNPKSVDFDFRISLGVGSRASSQLTASLGENGSCFSGTSQFQPTNVSFELVSSDLPEPSSVLLGLTALALAWRFGSRRR